MSNNKIYWRGIEELEKDPEFLKEREQEFPTPMPIDEFLGDEKLSSTSTNRRDFLKFLGFSVTAATLAACETPVKKAIPYVIKPDTITNGVANYYASSYYDGYDFGALMVKTREGRPIKINGNKLCKLTTGGTNARMQGSVISLYDNNRAKGPMKDGSPSTWGELDADISKKLADIAGKGKRTVILSSTVISPSTAAAIAKFSTIFGNVDHIQYDAVSYSAIREANKLSFGKSVIPHYHFEKARAIVSFGADFLNGWLLSNAYESGYAVTRNPKNAHMSRHFQFEALLSLAGSNADYRTQLKQSEIGSALVELHNYIAAKKGQAAASGGGPLDESVKAAIHTAGDYLIANAQHGLVVCGLNDVNAQFVTNAINTLLDNYTHTIHLDMATNLYKGEDAKVMAMIEDLKAGKIGGLICYGTNPAYTLPMGAEAFNQLIANLDLSVSFGDRMEETTAKYLAPDHHYLESWNDFEPVAGHYTLQQPTIRPLFDTRSAQESLLVWAAVSMRGDRNNVTYRDFIKDFWKTNLFPKASGYVLFDDFWNYSLHDGILDLGAGHASVAEVTTTTETPVAESGALTLNQAATKLAEIQKASSGIEVILYEKVGIGLGQHSNNPMLLEFPDPLSRVTWDNYITMAPADMKAQGYNQKMGQKEKAHVAKITVDGKTIALPVVAMPGQKAGTVGVALGYGRKFGRKQDMSVGVNAFPMVAFSQNYFTSYAWNASVEKTGERYLIAGTQTHHTMMGRAIIKETSLSEYKKDPTSGNPPVLMHTNLKDITVDGHSAPVSKIDYWKDFKMVNHRWGMSIDLNSCTGCGACVVSCHVENNVPIVGKDEVSRSRDMHWLRIDRYYTSDADPKARYQKGNDNFRSMEIPSDNPKVAFQPVMCQHCNHAPCETVCPVLATTHSSEGLNQMTYNRCVGTRYCANNCPYKVRRFNWFGYADNDKFDYYMNDDLGKMVLNPDVTVRARGVMEKCSLCVQRIQSGKLDAKKEGRPVKDQEIQTACSEVCPTNAIVFGDYNDPQSMIAQLETDERAYKLLEEIGIKPNVIYQTKIRNVAEEYGSETAAAHHGEHGDEGHHEEHKKTEDHSHGH